ncbi:EAL domain-containing protein [Mitsuokella sp. WILCCON 0060]|uniref:EAL domain-containing protein n=1 Tax=Mitsuokella sp. WILCCON 0060 TaxID=3345341 RepID=UPI003F1D1788
MEQGRDRNQDKKDKDEAGQGPVQNGANRDGANRAGNDFVKGRNDVTVLMGRTAFYKAALEQAAEDKDQGVFGKHCPLYFNITNFKIYNSIHGYHGGDEILQHMARLLQETFPDDLIAHLSADSFLVLATSENITQKVEHICCTMRRYIKSPGIEVKAGLRFYDPRQEKAPVVGSFDQAKMACDSIKKDANRCWAVYEDDMGKRLVLQNHILEHFDEAMQKDQIRFYLQPTVRTFTGKLCGAEALVRWEDPQYGLLTPDLIIPVLEEAGLIHKLDAYIIRKVASLLCYQRENDLPMMPISVNISPLDFTLMDPFAFVEDVMESLHLPHAYLNLELTESALVRDKSRLQKAITQFRAAGYKIWLDDFGSGYSSLNVLKDYAFDFLKLDMVFLRHFTEKSRDIITSVVRMAKEVGIHTLAEGVETKEQVAFLQSIGCEKIQGYYYGKPMSYEDFHQYYSEHHYEVEKPQEEKIYHQLGLLNCISEASLGIGLCDGKKISLIFANESFEKNLQARGFQDARQCREYLLQPKHPLCIRSLAMLKRIHSLHQKQARIFMENGRYFRVTAELLSETESLRAYNITLENQETRSVQRFDTIMHNLYMTFQDIFLLNLSRDTCEHLAGRDVSVESSRIYHGIDDFFRHYAETRLPEEEQERFCGYLNGQHLQSFFAKKGGLHAIDSFRVRQADGSLVWMRFDALRIHLVGSEEILVSAGPLSFELQDKKDQVDRIARSFHMLVGEETSASVLQDALLWRSFAEPTELMLFWKDKERRFIGANKSFLDFCDFKSLEDILGRTDDELSLHINDRPFREVEENVLQTGRTDHWRLGECAVKGKSVLVFSTKYPLYRSGRVEGLIGIAWPMEETQRNYQNATYDEDTGLLNYRGMLISGIEFMDNYLRNGQDFAAVYFYVPAFDKIAQKYGEETRLHLLQRITDVIYKRHRRGGILAHIGSCRFVGFFPKDKGDVSTRVLEVANAIHEIRSVDGFPCTLYLQYAIGYGSETENIEALLHLLVGRIEEAQKNKLGESIYIGDRIAFDREKFDYMDERIYMSAPETYDLVYLNRAVYKDFHLPEDFSCEGKKCYEVFGDGKAPCEFCTNHLLRRDRFYSWTHHNAVSGNDYLLRDTFVPWRGKNYRFSMGINLNEYLNRDIAANEILYREASINDAISLAMGEDDPSEGIRKLLWKIGSELSADRICIFELDEGGSTVSNTYEWCRSGVEPMREKMQHLPLNPCYIYENFRENHLVMIPDYPKYIKEHPDAQTYLPDIHRFAAVPLKIAGQIIGHLQIVNPQMSLFRATNFLMMTLSRFIASMIRSRRSLRELERMSCRDQLTGRLNRHGLSQYFASLPEHTSCAFIFDDINGLKRMNDEHGHEAGDRLITTVADIMHKKRKETGKGHVFRMGGDEFLIIIENIGEKQAEAFLTDLRASFRKHGVSVALGHLVCMTPLESMDPILVKVDRAMYEDKEKMKMSKKE